MQQNTKAGGIVILSIVVALGVGSFLGYKYGVFFQSADQFSSEFPEVQDVSEEASSGTWKLYEQNDFSFFVPSTWSQGASKDVLMPGTESSSFRFAMDIQNIEDINNERGLRTLAQQGNLREYERLLCVGQGGVLCPDPMIEVEDLYIEGGKGIKYIRRSEGPNGVQEIKRVTAVKDDKLYEFWIQSTAQASSGLTEDSKMLFDRIMNTLEIK